MDPDRRATPSEQAALDQPWRVWASILVGSFALVAILLGFIVLPLTEGRGQESLLVSICRAIGVPGFGYTPVDAGRALPTSAPGAPPSQLAWTEQTRRLILSGDRERGAAIVAETCSACHGEDGIAVDPAYPNLSGQSASAMFKQLHDFRSGSRQSGRAEEMIPFAQELNDQQMADVAAYYSSAHAREVVDAWSGVPMEITALAREGDPARALPACDACHGGALVGPEGALILTGQSDDYLEQQMQLFALGERHNDLYGRMRTIARALTPEEMHRLAIYYSGIFRVESADP